MDQNGELIFLPQDRKCLSKLTASSNVAEVLFFGRGELYLELLKDLWRLPRRPTIGFFLEELDDMGQVISPIRWSNSYFDYVFCAGPQAQISLLGYSHRELEVLVI